MSRHTQHWPDTERQDPEPPSWRDDNLHLVAVGVVIALVGYFVGRVVAHFVA